MESLLLSFCLLLETLVPTLLDPYHFSTVLYNPFLVQFTQVVQHTFFDEDSRDFLPSSGRPAPIAYATGYGDH